tara:strand:- start:322 stop:567 length:246 start_codon:yes stop_codon:yes gene_type:complete
MTSWLLHYICWECDGNKTLKVSDNPDDTSLEEICPICGGHGEIERFVENGECLVDAVNVFSSQEKEDHILSIRQLQGREKL